MPSLKNDLQTRDDYKFPTPRDDVRYFLSSDDVTTIDRLADSVRGVVEGGVALTNISTIIETDVRFFTALITLIQDGEIVC